MRCRDESRRFLPYMASQPFEDEIAVGSALMLLKDVAFYEQRAVSFRSLLDGVVAGGALRDVVLSTNGEVIEIELRRGDAIERIPAAGATVLPTRATAA